MSKLTKTERSALPVADFGDPTRRLFPIVDQADIDSAARLIGQTKDPESVRTRIAEIATRKGLTVPDAWQPATSPASFKTKPKAQTDEMSFEDVRSLLQTAIEAKTGSSNFWVKDVYSSAVVYRDYGLNKIYRRTYTIASDGEVALGEIEEVKQRTVYDPVKLAAFAMDITFRRVEGDVAVYPNSLLFVAGDYEDKGFSMTPEELAVAVEHFTPCGGNIEHTDFLAGRACEVRAIFLDEADPFILRGEVAVPLWLDENLGAEERKLSCEFDRQTKELAGIGLVVHPRVSEAALMTAFATHFAGKRHSAADSGDIQSMHDHSVKVGAVCAKAGKTAMAGRRNSKSDLTAIQSIHDLTVKQGAECTPATHSTEARMHTNDSAIKAFFADMGEKLTRLLGGGGGQAAPPKTDPPTDTPTTPEPPASETALVPTAEMSPAVAAQFTAIAKALTDVQAKLSATEQRLAAKDTAEAEATKESIAVQAAAFARDLAKAGKIPADDQTQANFAALYAQAAEDDRAHGVVTFGEGKGSVSRVDALRAMTAALVPNAMFGQTFDAGAMTRIFSTEQPKPGPSTDEQKKAFMSASQVGQAALKEVKQ